MILFELFGTEENPIYRDLQISNIARQYDFLRSLVLSSINAENRFLSQHILKALNFHAITCLHTNAGEYRPCQVTVGNHNPPEHYRVQALMDDFVNQVNSNLEKSDPIFLASYVLWRLNFIHPFINGNGRTARAACYFILCIKLGFWLPGENILPELILQHRERYVLALQQADSSLSSGTLDLRPLHSLLSELINKQLSTIQIAPHP